MLVVLCLWPDGFFEIGPGPVTIADREAEEAMVSVILESFPTHAM
jgi:fructose-1,6-bisphosphatase/inositol monophosphatase family enzyme